MDARFIQEGNSIDYTPSSAVAAGDVVIQDGLIGVAVKAIAANTPGSIMTVGVFDFTKAASDGGIAVGADVFWDAVNGVATDDIAAGANKYLGKCVLAAATAAVLVRVRLNDGGGVKKHVAFTHVATAGEATATEAVLDTGLGVALDWAAAHVKTSAGVPRVIDELRLLTGADAGKIAIGSAALASGDIIHGITGYGAAVL